MTVFPHTFTNQFCIKKLRASNKCSQRASHRIRLSRPDSNMKIEEPTRTQMISLNCIQFQQIWNEKRRKIRNKKYIKPTNLWVNKNGLNFYEFVCAFVCVWAYVYLSILTMLRVQYWKPIQHRLSHKRSERENYIKTKGKRLSAFIHSKREVW